MQSEASGHTTPKRRHRHLVVTSVLCLFLVGALAGGGWLFFKYRQAVDNNPKTIEERTIQEVAEMVEVPGEKPSVVTVTDASKLSNKELASRAQNEDKLLIYADSKRIVIFRPSSGKVVDMLTIRDVASTATEQEVVKPE